MKPLVLMSLLLGSGEKLSVYLDLEQFSKLRAGAASAMKQIFGI